MNRSKFYFLFSLFAAVLVGGVLLFGFFYPLNAKANVCIQGGQNDNSSISVELGTGLMCAPDGGGESAWAFFRDSRSIEAVNVGFYPACIKAGQNDNNDDFIESETSWFCATDAGESGWATYTGSRSLEAIKVKNNAGGGEVCVKAGQNDNNDDVIEDQTDWKCASANSESPWAFYRDSRSIEAVKIKFTPAAPTLLVTCSPKNISLNVGDVRTFTGSASNGTPSYAYQWSNVTCGEEWTCQSNGQIFNTENQCRNSCSGSCIHTSGQNIQSCKLFFGAPGTYNPTVTVRDSAGANRSDSCPVNVTGPVCGNGSIESGEQCDTGSSRGVCPATCSLSCTTNSCGPTTGNVYVSVKIDGVEVTDANKGSFGCATLDGCIQGIIASCAGPSGISFNSLPHWYANKPTGTYTCNPPTSVPSGKQFQSISYGTNGQTLMSGQTITAYYNLTSAPTPQCFINGQVNGHMDVKVGDRFVIPWSNSPNLGTLISSGWSGPITCWGPDVPDPNNCKARYLGSGGLPACPPESGKCIWASSDPGTYLYFQNPGTSAVSVTATTGTGPTEQRGICTYSVTATAQPKFRCSGSSCIRDDVNGTFTDPSCNNQCTQPPQCTLVISPPSGSVQRGSIFQFSALYDPDGPGGQEREESLFTQRICRTHWCGTHGTRLSRH